MFNRKTVFIIGAGAGKEINLPIGRELAKDIADRTKVSVSHFGRIQQGTYDEEFALSFFERQDQPGWGQNYLGAFNLIRNGILLANSIDDFLNIHEKSSEVVAVGKAAIIRSILNAERNSHIFVDPSNVYNTLHIEKIQTSWLVKFMQVLGPGRKVADVERVLDDVSFIVFNYDRCLEHFLTYALRLLYGISREQATSIVGRARIIHPYGSVGPLNRVPFGGDRHARLDYFQLASSIKTYTERVDEQSTLNNIEQVIKHAECVVFLGFAYHKQNMELLFKSHERPRKTIHVFGTALGMSQADKDQVADQLSGYFPDIDEEDPMNRFDPPSISDILYSSPALGSTDHIHIENGLGCSQLFDHYAKSLAG